jgi:hypothetical protein
MNIHAIPTCFASEWQFACNGDGELILEVRLAASPLATAQLIELLFTTPDGYNFSANVQHFKTTFQTLYINSVNILVS